MKIRKGDTVKVISGKDRGKTGKVLRILKASDKVVIANINVIKKHKKSQGDGKDAGIIEFEAPIHSSNVMIYDETDKKTSRVKIEVKKGKKIRVLKANNKKLDK